MMTTLKKSIGSYQFRHEIRLLSDPFLTKAIAGCCKNSTFPTRTIVASAPSGILFIIFGRFSSPILMELLLFIMKCDSDSFRRFSVSYNI